MKPRKWATKLDGIKCKNGVHFCTSCLHSQKETWANLPCPQCQITGSRVYMASQAELKRSAELVLMQKAGQITNLRFQPRYDLVVEGVKVCTYVGDSEYRINGKVIVEDTKPMNFIDKTAEIKINLFNALYRKMGMQITLHKRKS